MNSLFETMQSITRTAAIQAGAKFERTPDEMLTDILIAEPALKEARAILAEQSGKRRMPERWDVGYINVGDGIVTDGGKQWIVKDVFRNTDGSLESLGCTDKDGEWKEIFSWVAHFPRHK